MNQCEIVLTRQSLFEILLVSVDVYVHVSMREICSVYIEVGKQMTNNNIMFGVNPGFLYVLMKIVEDRM